LLSLNLVVSSIGPSGGASRLLIDFRVAANSFADPLVSAKIGRAIPGERALNDSQQRTAAACRHRTLQSGRFGSATIGPRAGVSEGPLWAKAGCALMSLIPNDRDKVGDRQSAMPVCKAISSGMLNDKMLKKTETVNFNRLPCRGGGGCKHVA
jgi:hypothetical protein